jgi:hypothetical protein
MADETQPTGSYTVAALYEDTIDAAQAVGALRKAGHAPETISLLVGVGDADGRILVGRAVADADIGDHGSWLVGLAALRLPGRGDFLGAGPLGAVLAAIGPPDTDIGEAGAAGAAGAGDLESLLFDFGFSYDEAGYVAHRLVAGAPLVAVTAGPDTPSRDLRRILADHSAVYLGTAETGDRFLLTAQTLLEAPPEASSGGEVEVADAVGPLRSACGVDALARFAHFRGRRVVDAHGEEVGAIDDVLVECLDPDGPAGPEPEQQTLRYVVVGSGGLLGLSIGRRRVAVPIALADLNEDPVRLGVEQAVVQAAPTYDDGDPFSRRDEMAINAFFGERPYWLDATDAPVKAPVAAEEPPLGGLATAPAG